MPDTPQIVRHADPPHKGRNEPKSTRPGIELAKLTAEGIHHGRPGCRLGQVPGTDLALAIPQVKVRIDGEGLVELVPRREPASAVLPQRLALALETDHRAVWDSLGAHDWAAAKRLRAAALRDLVGLSDDAIAEDLGFADPANARHAVSRGRSAWHRLLAWPWACWYPDGRPPTSWRQDHDADPQVAAIFAAWQRGSVRPADFATAA